MDRDRGFCAFAAESLLGRLLAMTGEVPGVREAADRECVHRMRVASRRLRSALSLFAECLPPKRVNEWRKGVREITRALGAARDLDVQVAFLEGYVSGLEERRLAAGPERVMLRLVREREAAQKEVLEALDHFGNSGIAGEMSARLRPELGKWKLEGGDFRASGIGRRAGEAIRSRMEEVLGFEGCVDHPEDREGLHAMRIANKRLRYVMEVFAPLYEGGLKEELRRIREFHALLGDVHDCDVWEARLSRFLEEERRRTLDYLGHTRNFSRIVSGIEALSEDRRHIRGERYGAFRDLYFRTRGEGFWETLSRRIGGRGGPGNAEGGETG